MATRRALKIEPASASVASAKRPRRAFAEDNPAAEKAGASYFASSAVRAAVSSLEFFSTGSVLLDQVLGGGWVLGRMENVIGDKSTGKTLLAIEASANFKRTFSDGVIRYAEAESAFDKPYAAELGLPPDIEFVDFLKAKKKKTKADRRDEDEAPELLDAEDDLDRTVEFFAEDVRAFLQRLKGRPGLYILDSLDALSDRAELSAKDGEQAGYGMQKAKALHAFFRRLVGDIERSRCCLLIISQIKDKIGVTFGETKMRTGGHSMDFYASHCLWLAHIGQVKKTIDGIERVVAVEVKANCKKNKVGLPFRQCTFQILFGYGIDDLSANVEWLIDVGRHERLKEVEMSKSGYKLRVSALRNRGGAEVREVRQKLNAIVLEEWSRIETTFLPQSKKYS